MNNLMGRVANTKLLIRQNFWAFSPSKRILRNGYVLEYEPTDFFFFRIESIDLRVFKKNYFANDNLNYKLEFGCNGTGSLS